MPTRNTLCPAAWELVSTPIPESLWHYTNFAAVKGIVEGSSIFATDIRFLNDSEELVHARALVEKIAEEEEVALPNTSNIFREAIHREIRFLFDSGPLNSKSVQTFVACFSKARDQLSQWRAYSGTSTGAALGLDLRRLRGDINRPLAVFAPCLYREEDKRAVLRAVFSGLFRRVEENMMLAYNAADEALKTGDAGRTQFEEWFSNSKDRVELGKRLDESRIQTGYELLHIAALMKHPSFYEEDEWRLVVPILTGFNDEKHTCIFDTSPTTLIPRLVQSFGPKGPPVVEVIIGPGSHPAAEEAMASFFATRAECPRVVRSSATYRRSH